MLQLTRQVACRSPPSRRAVAVVAKCDSFAPARTSFADRRVQRSNVQRKVVCGAAAASAAASGGDEAVRASHGVLYMRYQVAAAKLCFVCFLKAAMLNKMGTTV